MLLESVHASVAAINGPVARFDQFGHVELVGSCLRVQAADLSRFDPSMAVYTGPAALPDSVALKGAIASSCVCDSLVEQT